MSSNHLPPEETKLRDKRIAELTRTGHTATEISVIVGITKRSVQRARVRTGTAQPYNGAPVTADELRTAAAMLDDGASYNEVARTIGRSSDRIRKYLPGRSSWSGGSGYEYRRLMVALDAIQTPDVSQLLKGNR